MFIYILSWRFFENQCLKRPGLTGTVGLSIIVKYCYNTCIFDYEGNKVSNGFMTIVNLYYSSKLFAYTFDTKLAGICFVHKLCSWSMGSITLG